MKGLLSTSLVCILSLDLLSQDCSCASQFLFVKNYYEANNPAFQKIKNNATLYKNYTRQVKRLTKDISSEKSNDRCNLYFDRYVALLKDHHSGIDINLRLNIDINNQKSLDSFKSTAYYKSFKKITIDTTTLLLQLKSKLPSDVEGLYSNGRNIIIGVLKTTADNYIGVVMRKNKLLDVGQILLELKKINNTSFECVYHTGLLAVNFKSVYKNIGIKNGRMPEIDFFKESVQKNVLDKQYSFTELDTATNYLKLASFDKSLKQELDSFYHSIDSLIQSKPYLVIDLRDNGGGAEACYLGLMKYLYTRPLKVDNIEVWVSPDNIKRYEEISYNPKLGNRMKEAKPFTFIPQVLDGIEKWTMIGTTYPKKIVVLFNRLTGSSAEGMITYCMQSDKVVTMGENSGGFMGYGDVMTVTIPCGKFSLRSTTTKYHDNSKYEFVGITPMYRLSSNQDWIEAAKQMLYKHR